MKPVYEFFGGRKAWNGHIYAGLTTFMALKLDAQFSEYATWLAIALLGTSAMVAYEDLKRKP